MIPIPTPIILPSGSSGGPPPNARDMSAIAFGAGVISAALLGLRWVVWTRTGEYMCTLDSIDPRSDGCTRFGTSAYDLIHEMSGMFAWIMFGVAMLCGLLAGPFLATRRWVRSSWGPAMATYTLLAALMLAVPTPGPEFLDPIRTILVVCWALSLITYSVTGFRSLRPASVA